MILCVVIAAGLDKYFLTAGLERLLFKEGKAQYLLSIAFLIDFACS